VSSWSPPITLCIPRLQTRSGTSGVFTTTAPACSGRGSCLGAVEGYCKCHPGFAGANCEQCADGYLFQHSTGRCVFLPGSLSSCSDGTQTGNELGVDCGGPNCAPCSESDRTGPSSDVLKKSCQWVRSVASGGALLVTHSSLQSKLRAESLQVLVCSGLRGAAAVGCLGSWVWRRLPWPGSRSFCRGPPTRSPTRSPSP
jgi:hypothetical protein